MSAPGEGAGSPIAPGTTLGDGTRVGDYLGRSSGALNFYGEHPDAGRVSIKVLAPPLDGPLESMRTELLSLRSLTHPAMQRVVSLGTIGPRNLLVYSYIDGRTLRSALERRVADRGPFDLAGTYNVIGHASSALELLHTVMPHGVLTDENVFVLRNGAILVGNVGFSQLMLRAYGGDSEVFGTSAFLAPEVRDDPWAATEASDMYSLGVLTVELLTGEQPTRANLPELVDAAVASTTPGMREFLDRCLAAEPLMRFPSLAALRAELSALRKARPEPGESLQSAEIFGALGLSNAPTLDEDAGHERWLVRRDAGDFGPYTTSAIKQMLEADEIDEHTLLIDLDEDSVASIVDVPVFTDFVMDYLPRRQKRRLQQAERREEVIQTVKRTSMTTVVTSIVALIVGGVLLSQLQFQTPPVPLDAMFRTIPHTFEVIEPSFTEIAANPELVASLFDVSEPLPEPEAPTRRSGQGSAAQAEPVYVAPSLEDYVVSFDSSRPARKLSQDEVNQTLASHARRLQECFREEMSANSGFAGLTVQCAIVPDGRTAEIEVSSSGPLTAAGRRCVRRTFERMRFPEFNDVPMRVSFPFVAQ